MIDCRSASSGSETVLERVPSATPDGSVSLTWLWEVIVRTKRLPDNIEPRALFLILRDRLRNPEREVRQNALRVLADLIPVVDPSPQPLTQGLDPLMALLLPELTSNLSHVAPAVRKGTVDVFRIYLKYTDDPNAVLRNLLTSVPEDSHLMVGLVMAASYFVTAHIDEDTLTFVLRHLVEALKHEFLKETSISSLVKIRTRLGSDKFNRLIGSEALDGFQRLCEERNIQLQESEDNVIMETEITLEKGPAITMKIHEEKGGPRAGVMDVECARRDRQLFNILTDESDLDEAMRSPRKVHFGGEVVKMRTPESDSNQPSDDNSADLQTSILIDKPTSIKITVGQKVTSIRTKHKSLIPVRITTGSIPSTPRKKIKDKRLHKSAPELSRLHLSRIPQASRSSGSGDSKDKELSVQKSSATVVAAAAAPKSEKKTESVKKKPPRIRREGLSPIPVHNEVQILHNLARSPDRSPERPHNEDNEKEPVQAQAQETSSSSLQVTQNNSFQLLPQLAVNKQDPPSNPPSPEPERVIVPFSSEPFPSIRRNSSASKHDTMQQQRSNLAVPKAVVAATSEEAEASEAKPVETNEKQMKEQAETEDTSASVKVVPLVENTPIPLPENTSSAAKAPLPNLQRPSASQGYNSFQIYRETEVDANVGMLDIIIQDLIRKDDGRSKSVHLDDLMEFLRLNSFPPLSAINYQSLLRALFYCEQQTYLQHRAQEALRMFISSVNPEIFHESLPTLSSGLLRISNTQTSVRLGLIAMQRGSPRVFLDLLKPEPGTRERVLQFWIAASRTFPSSNIDVVKGTGLACELMNDRRRAVRQAALEALASFAQIAGNTLVLDTTSRTLRTTKDEEESLNFLGIIRTRLSRKQLPIVDLNGNVRYSSPREQEEFDWLCGGHTITKTASLNSIRNGNFWKHNSKHDGVLGLGGGSEVSDGSSEVNKEQAWNFEGSAVEKGTLCPVYVLQRDSPQFNGKSYRNYDRGRSNSPPNRSGNIADSDGNTKASRRFFKTNERFRKSFSSEHIYSGARGSKSLEPTSFSLSSRSSTTSTGSSTRSGLWLRDFRSGIPVPIAADSKLKLRTSRQSSDSSTGPLVAQDALNSFQTLASLIYASIPS